MYTLLICSLIMVLILAISLRTYGEFTLVKSKERLNSKVESEEYTKEKLLWVFYKNIESCTTNEEVREKVRQCVPIKINDNVLTYSFEGDYTEILMPIDRYYYNAYVYSVVIKNSKPSFAFYRHYIKSR